MRAALQLLLALTCYAADAVEVGGARWEVVGFTSNGAVLLQRVSEQLGVQAFELRRLADGQVMATHALKESEEPKAVGASLKREHRVTSPGFPGASAPDRSAAVLVLPGAAGLKASFTYDILVVDTAGTRVVAALPVPADCPTTALPHGRVTVQWAPDGRTAVVAGAVMTLSPCDAPTLEPVLALAHATGPTSLPPLVPALEKTMARLLKARPAEALGVAAQLLAVAPENVAALLVLAQVRAMSGNLRGALSALWALARVPSAAAREQLAHALDARWTVLLRDRAAFKALELQAAAPM